MSRLASAGVDADWGVHLAQWLPRLLSVVLAAGLTALLWLGAAAESSRHQVPASPRATSYITLPTVVVTAHRPADMGSQIVARTAECARVSAE